MTSDRKRTPIADALTTDDPVLLADLLAPTVHNMRNPAAEARRRLAARQAELRKEHDE